MTEAHFGQFAVELKLVGKASGTTMSDLGRAAVKFGGERVNLSGIEVQLHPLPT